MKEKSKENNSEIEEIGTDNIAENTTNEQYLEDSSEDNNELSDKLATELAELKDTHLRLQAEYDNYRRRTLKEKSDLIKNGGEQALTGMLPIVDDFERALENMNTPDDVSRAIAEGVRLIYNKLMAYLNQNGVKVIETEGKDFDDNLFDAIATVPSPDGKQKGKVIDCVQKGYMLNDKVIRHAKVVVGE